jgi:orotidine-5'-phosphate decarboxylase
MSELILALDLPRAADAFPLLDRLPDLRWVKVGPMLMTREGPGLIRDLIGRGLKVFLDLKWHDIPNTVAGAISAAREMGVSMATVHTLGGQAMLESAAVAAGLDVDLVGVTVLTSHGPSEYAGVVGRSKVDISAEVERLALVAVESGLRGVVCSALEVSVLRRRLGRGPYIVVPGIRRRSDPVGDQARVATAKDASDNGATHLVVGRPLLQAPDPAAAFQDVRREAQCGRS